MGLEAQCDVVLDGKTVRAKVHLDSHELTIRAAKGKPLKLALSELQRADARGGWLEAATAALTVKLQLGKDAERWALKLRYPRERLAKLGVKPGLAVTVIRIEESEFAAELSASGAALLPAKNVQDADVIFLGVAAPHDLADVPKLRSRMKPAAALWVIRPKGKDTPVSEAAVRDAARQHALVDIKVVSFSETHSADKLVIPVALRGR